jgi:hypothetical protein
MELGHPDASIIKSPSRSDTDLTLSAVCIIVPSFSASLPS